MAPSFACPVCHGIDETPLYAVWACPTLKAVRSTSGVAHSIPFKSLPSTADFLFVCSSLLKQEEIDLLLVVLWRNWFRCNKVIHDSVILNSQYVVP
ncbi:hypothetical protein ACOSQ2_022375 [Xanthoceras sorbifolium]